MILVLLGSSADAKAGNTTLRGLIEYSDEIATVDIDEIGLIHGVRIAMGRVEKSYGRLRINQRIAVVAHSTWTCEVSGAVRKGGGLLFLSELPRQPRGLSELKYPNRLISTVSKRHGPNVPVFYVAHTGWGWMPLKRENRQDCVEGRYVHFPVRLQTADAPEPRDGWGRVYALHQVESYLEQALAPPSDQFAAEMTAEKVLRLIREWEAVPDDEDWLDALKSLPKMVTDTEGLIWSLLNMALAEHDATGYPGDISGRVTTALVRLGKPAMPQLIETLKDDDSTVVAIVARALGKLEPPPLQAVASLRELLSATDVQVVASAVDALGSIGPAAMPAVPQLLELRTTATERFDDCAARWIESAVLCAIAYIAADDRTMIPMLIGLLKENPAKVDPQIDRLHHSPAVLLRSPWHSE